MLFKMVEFLSPMFIIHLVQSFVSTLSYAIGIWVLIQILFYMGESEFFVAHRHPVNLRAKYRTDWAVVTGGSSGIGSEIVDFLAEEGFNLIIIALDDDMLRKKISVLTKKYDEDRRFIDIGIDLSKDDPIKYLEDIIRKDDIDVGLVINNAGYIKIGRFEEIPVEEQIDNFKVNSLSYLRISHFFYGLWIQSQRNCGCLAFNVSCSSFFFQPYSIMYGASKAFDNYFSTSLAIEAIQHGIEVVTFNPQMVTSKHFYENVSNFVPLTILNYLFPTTPKDCAHALLSSLGRVHIRNHGWFSHFLFFLSTSFFGSQNYMILLLGGILGWIGFDT